MAQALSKLTKPQLAKISHKLDDYILDAIMLASRIDPTNQGRPRQEKLVGKLLGLEYDEEELQELLVRPCYVFSNKFEFLQLAVEIWSL